MISVVVSKKKSWCEIFNGRAPYVYGIKSPVRNDDPLLDLKDNVPSSVQENENGGIMLTQCVSSDIFTRIGDSVADLCGYVLREGFPHSSEA